MKHYRAACPALFQNAKHAERAPGKAMARPIQRSILQDEADAPSVGNLFSKLIDSTPPAELGPLHATKFQSDSLLLQGIAKEFTIFEDSIGWLIPPTDNRNPTFMHLRESPGAASTGEGGA